MTDDIVADQKTPEKTASSQAPYDTTDGEAELLVARPQVTQERTGDELVDNVLDELHDMTTRDDLDAAGATIVLARLHDTLTNHLADTQGPA